MDQREGESPKRQFGDRSSPFYHTTGSLHFGESPKRQFGDRSSPFYLSELMIN